MNRVKYIITLAAILIVGSGEQAHAGFIDNIKAGIDSVIIKTQHKSADKKFYGLSYAKAIDKYEKVIKKGVEPDSLNRNLAIAYYKVHRTIESERLLAELVKKQNRTESDVYYYAQSLKYNEKYHEADKWIEEYKRIKEEDSRGILQFEAEPVIKEILSEDRYEISTVYFNSKYSDFGAVVVDDKVVFASGRNDQAVIQYEYSWKGQPYLDLYETPVEKPVLYKEATILTKGINSRFHDGPACYSLDKREVFLSRNNFTYGMPKYSEKKENHFMLYSAKRTEKGWGEMVPLPFNSNEYSCGHPSLSTDNSTLYFASDMPGGFGGSDIYFAERTDDGWSTPVNLGKDVNTEGDEMFPFISSANELYFSSNGRLGLGGLDVFMAEKIGEGKYDVINMGHPLNSSADDFSFYLLPTGNDGYFASNREGGKGDDDIYKFKMLDRPSSVIMLIGTVKDSESGEVLSNAEVVVLDSKDNEVYAGTTSNDGKLQFEGKYAEMYMLEAKRNGYSENQMEVIAEKEKTQNKEYEFYVPMDLIKEWGVFGFVYNKETGNGVEDVEVVITPKDGSDGISVKTNESGNVRELLQPDTDYDILLKKPEYFTRRGEFSTKGMKPGWIDIKEFIEVEMEEVIIGKTIEIPNIYYDLGKWNIREDAAVELDKVVQFLKDNKTITIELGSHTDARGSKSSNQSLSQKRAESAVNYIVEKGIAKSRITARGYGESKLKNRCADGVRCSEDEHQANRRTEIKIVNF